MKLKLNLDRILFERRIRQIDLAEQSGLSMGTVNAIANNRYRRIDLETLAKLCSTLEVPVEQLIVADNDH